MGLINGSLQIGRSTIETAQAALQVIGNNIANASDPNYTRKRVQTEPITVGEQMDRLRPGMGVRVSSINRLADEAINARLRSATSDQYAAESASDVLGRVETVFNALGDDNLSTRLEALFNAFSELANEPQSSARRSTLLQAASAVARTLSRTHQQLLDIRLTVNRQVQDLAGQANDLIDRIAELNGQITEVEFGQVDASAGSLRDRRDAALAELSELVNLTTYSGENGAINVYLGSTPMVMGADAFGLEVAQDLSAGFPDTVLRFEADGQPANVTGGRIGGLIVARDQTLRDTSDQLDAFAAALIGQVNLLHAEGQGLGGFSSITGTYAVSSTAAALNAAGLGLTPTNGTFQVHLTDAATGVRVSRVVEVDLDGVGAEATLASLAAALDGLAGLSASANADGTLTLTAASGYAFTFSDDTSGVLAALGVNTFFDGHNAGDIAVRAGLTGATIAAATNHSPADNGNALRLAALADAPVAALGDVSLADGYAQLVVEAANATADAEIEMEASQALVDSLSAQRSAVSGVSIDEETIDLMRYQRSFQGAARYISLVNELLGEVMDLI